MKILFRSISILILYVYRTAVSNYKFILKKYNRHFDIVDKIVELGKYDEKEFHHRSMFLAMRYFRSGIENFRLALHVLGYDEEGNEL